MLIKRGKRFILHGPKTPIFGLRSFPLSISLVFEEQFSWVVNSIFIYSKVLLFGQSPRYLILVHEGRFIIIK